jgi:hypothetical protein
MENAIRDNNHRQSSKHLLEMTLYIIISRVQSEHSSSEFKLSRIYEKNSGILGFRALK